MNVVRIVCGLSQCSKRSVVIGAYKVCGSIRHPFSESRNLVEGGEASGDFYEQRPLSKCLELGCLAFESPPVLLPL